MKSTLEFVAEASKYESVLDVGCGLGDYLNHITSKTRVGIDICAKAIEIAKERAETEAKERAKELAKKSRKKRTKDRVDEEWVRYVEMDLCNLQLYIDKGYFKGFECVIGTDILEHFEKDMALKMLSCCEEIATKCLLWFIPVGVHEQDSDPWNLGNDQYQQHKSVWEPEDMLSRGYEVWYFKDWHALKADPVPPTNVGAMYCKKLLDDKKWNGAGKCRKRKRFPNATIEELKPKRKRKGKSMPEPEVELVPKTKQEIDIEISQEPMTEREARRKRRLETHRKELEARLKLKRGL